MIKTYLIQSTYGIEETQNNPAIKMTGLSLWTLEYDGTPEDLHSALTNAQNNSDSVRAYKKRAERCGAENHGSWLVFSVIERFDVDTRE